MSYNPLHSWYYSIDPELRLVHCFEDCAETKIAKKYRYLKNLRVQTVEDARYMDHKMQADHLRICIRCWHREQDLARKDKRAVRPGFRAKPSDWREPKPKKVAGRTARKNVVRD